MINNIRHLFVLFDTKDIKFSFLYSFYFLKSHFTFSRLGLIWEFLNFWVFIFFVSFFWSYVLDISFVHSFTRLSFMFAIWRFFFTLITDSCTNLKSRSSLYINNPEYKNFAFVPFFYAFLRFILHFPFTLAICYLFISPIFDFSLFLLLFLWFIFFLLNAFTLSIFCAFLKDFANFVNLAMTFIMLITPVLWSAEKFGDNWILLLLNPLSIPLIISDKFLNINNLIFIDNTFLYFASLIWFIIFIFLFYFALMFKRLALKYIGL